MCHDEWHWWAGGGSPVGGENASRPHGNMLRDDDSLVDFNETFFNLNETFFNQTRYNETAFDVVASVLNIYYTPFLVLFGVIGNILSVFTFFTSKLRLQSTSQYLSALAISDTVFLLQLLTPWLNALQVASAFHRQGWCQLFVYVSYVSCSMSSWLVVAFTVERFVAVLYPLKRNILCTVNRARSIIFGLGCTSLLLNLPVLRFATPNRQDCNIDMYYLDHAARFNLLDTGVSFTMPLVMIVFLNVWIIIGVCRLERARKLLLKQQQSESLAGEVSVRSRLRARLTAARTPRTPPRAQQRVTRMLLIVSSVFVLLNLPAYSMRVLAYAYDIDQEEFTDRWDGLQQLALMFFNTNFGINFLLYCLSGQNFRRALLQAMPWLRMRKRHAEVARRNLSLRPTGVSSLSEVSVNYNTAHAGSTPDLRQRRHAQGVISRWTFDNSRQREQAAAAPAHPEQLEIVEIHAPYRQPCGHARMRAHRTQRILPAFRPRESADSVCTCDTYI